MIKNHELLSELLSSLNVDSKAGFELGFMFSQITTHMSNVSIDEIRFISMIGNTEAFEKLATVVDLDIHFEAPCETFPGSKCVVIFKRKEVTEEKKEAKVIPLKLVVDNKQINKG